MEQQQGSPSLDLIVSLINQVTLLEHVNLAISTNYLKTTQT